MIKITKNHVTQLAKFLNDDLGWSVYEETELCPSCGIDVGLFDVYCRSCGEELPEKKEEYLSDETIKGLKEILEKVFNNKK